MVLFCRVLAVVTGLMVRADRPDGSLGLRTLADDLTECGSGPTMDSLGGAEG